LIWNGSGDVNSPNRREQFDADGQRTGPLTELNRFVPTKRVSAFMIGAKKNKANSVVSR
jgi:hypothetical protein